MAQFRVGVSQDFLKADGKPAFPSYDLTPLREDPAIALVELGAKGDLAPAALEGLDAVVLLLERVTPASFPADGRLALIARMGVGYDTIDVPACTANDVALTITPDGVRRPMAVVVLTLMLALAGKLFVKDRITREGPDGWPKRLEHHGLGLIGRTLASIGVGNIGAEVFRLAKPLDMRFIAHDPYIDPAKARQLGVELVGLEDAFRQADVLTLNCPLTRETRHLVNAERLALMKPSAYLINTSRGPVVDQPALCRALAERRIAGAGLDVLDQEPPRADDPILRLDNVIFAPHALGWTDQMFSTMADVNMRAIQAVKAGLAPENVVNRAVLDRPGFRAKLAARQAPA